MNRTHLIGTAWLAACFALGLGDAAAQTAKFPVFQCADVNGNLVNCGGSGGSANAYPGADYSTSGKQDTGNASLGGIATSDSNIATATGTQADAATASGANSSIVGALRAIRDKLLGSIAVTGTFFQATQPVSNAGTFPVQISNANINTNTIAAARVAAVGTGATAVQVGPVTAQFMKIRNMDTTNVAYLGGASVSSANGYPLAPGAEIQFDAKMYQGTFYAICTSGQTATLAVLTF